MKKITTIILLSIFLLLTTSTLVGCTKDNNRFNTELFNCMYNKDKTGVIILELTEKGQEQEILVIPEEINNLPVVQLGAKIKNVSYSLHSDITKKIYVGAEVLFSAEDIDMDELSEMIILPFNLDDNFRITYSNRKTTIYIEKGIIGTGYFENLGFHPSYNDAFKEANVTFYSENSICFIDNYSTNGLYAEPFIPLREGYTFVGWFIDADFINEWNGIYPENEKINVYAKWE